MTPDQVLDALKANRSERAEAIATLAGIEAEERSLTVAAWRAGLAPSAIAAAADRSEAHIRKQRPADVPPRRLGGTAAKPRRRKATPGRA